MTERRRASGAVQAWVDASAAAVGLSGWRFATYLAPLDHLAHVDIDTNGIDVDLIIDPKKYRSLTPQARRELLAHEMTHVLLDPLNLGPNRSAAEESVCDRIAISLAHLLPEGPRFLRPAQQRKST